MSNSKTGQMNLKSTLINSWNSWVKVVDGVLYVAPDLGLSDTDDWSVVDTPDAEFLLEVESTLHVKIDWKGHGYAATVSPQATDDDLILVADIMHNSIETMEDVAVEALANILENTDLSKDDVVKFLLAETNNYMSGIYHYNKIEDDLTLLRRYFR